MDKLFDPVSIWFILFMLGAFLIGLITGWIIWRRANLTLRAANADLEAKLSKLRGEHDKLKEEYNSKVTDLERANKEIETLKAKIKRLEAEKGQLWGDFDASKKQVVGLEEELALCKKSKNKGTKPAPNKESAKGDAPKAKKAAPKKGNADQAKKDVAAMMGSRIPKATAENKDDLKKISGVGPFIEKKLNALSIYTFNQISQFDDDIVQKVTDAIEFFPGRIQRDNWIDQSKKLHKEKYG